MAAIPEELVLRHDAQARINHSQSVRRLWERGGLAPAELAAVLNNRKYRAMSLPDALVEIAEAIRRYENEDRDPS